MILSASKNGWGDKKPEICLSDNIVQYFFVGVGGSVCLIDCFSSFVFSFFDPTSMLNRPGNFSLINVFLFSLWGSQSVFFCFLSGFPFLFVYIFLKFFFTFIVFAERPGKNKQNKTVFSI